MKPIYADFHEAEAEAEDRAMRARDGIVTGAARARSFSRVQSDATWLVVARNDEALDDFFLESPFGPDDCSPGEDPVPWICRGVEPDGTVRMGAVDLGVDRFVSDVLSDELRAALRKARC
jgi:hypothetical protein